MSVILAVEDNPENMTFVVAVLEASRLLSHPPGNEKSLHSRQTTSHAGRFRFTFN